jgi:sterol 24-C-methyltransferase
MFRCVKPGGRFAVYEWGMTDKYDPTNPTHAKIKHGIEEGNGLPTLAHNKDIVAAVRAAGFGTPFPFSPFAFCFACYLVWR